MHVPPFFFKFVFMYMALIIPQNMAETHLEHQHLTHSVTATEVKHEDGWIIRIPHVGKF